MFCYGDGLSPKRDDWFLASCHWAVSSGTALKGQEVTSLLLSEVENNEEWGKSVKWNGAVLLGSPAGKERMSQLRKSCLSHWIYYTAQYIAYKWILTWNGITKIFIYDWSIKVNQILLLSKRTLLSGVHIFYQNWTHNRSPRFLISSKLQGSTSTLKRFPQKIVGLLAL
jgi:hypothetical protein